MSIQTSSFCQQFKALLDDDFQRWNISTKQTKPFSTELMIDSDPKSDLIKRMTEENQQIRQDLSQIRHITVKLPLSYEDQSQMDHFTLFITTRKINKFLKFRQSTVGLSTKEKYLQCDNQGVFELLEHHEPFAYDLNQIIHHACNKGFSGTYLIHLLEKQNCIFTIDEDGISDSDVDLHPTFVSALTTACFNQRLETIQVLAHYVFYKTKSQSFDRRYFSKIVALFKSLATKMTQFGCPNVSTVLHVSIWDACIDRLDSKDPELIRQIVPELMNCALNHNPPNDALMMLKLLEASHVIENPTSYFLAFEQHKLPQEEKGESTLSVQLVDHLESIHQKLTDEKLSLFSILLRVFEHFGIMEEASRHFIALGTKVLFKLNDIALFERMNQVRMTYGNPCMKGYCSISDEEAKAVSLSTIQFVTSFLEREQLPDLILKMRRVDRNDLVDYMLTIL